MEVRRRPGWETNIQQIGALSLTLGTRKSRSPHIIDSFTLFYPLWTKTILGYVSDVKKVLFGLTKGEMEKVYTTHQRRTPDSLTSQFINRLTRDQAITHQATRKNTKVALYPPGDVLSFFIPTAILSTETNFWIFGTIVKEISCQV